MKIKVAIAAVIFIVFFLGGDLSLVFAEKVKTSDNFPAIEESIAYQRFLTRPETELSKLIYLVDRFEKTDIEFFYENMYYKTSFVAPFVRMFLATRYDHKPARFWVLHWSSTSIPSGKPVWIKYRDGKTRLAREVFLEELDFLDNALKKERTHQ